METIYSHPLLTTWFIIVIGFWLTVAASQINKKINLKLFVIRLPHINESHSNKPQRGWSL